ncbi:sigma-70 family RNA polymerase sigma factor [Spirillospora sp. NPDC047279]|uniref:RNA polymerase sigma factor n=1 Tax=Spirillospora sp. NPDC047279 TaxID=3155478 RepID=UPI0034084449
MPNPQRDHDRRLADGLRDQRPGAVAHVYNEYGPRLFEYAEALLDDRDLAVDAVRSALLVTRTKDLPDDPRFRAWLYSLVRDECLDRLGERPRPRPRPAPPAPFHVPRTADRLIFHYAADDLERELTDLKHHHGLAILEVAEVLGITVQQAAEIEAGAAAHTPPPDAAAQAALTANAWGEAVRQENGSLEDTPHLAFDTSTQATRSAPSAPAASAVPVASPAVASPAVAALAAVARVPSSEAPVQAAVSVQPAAAAPVVAATSGGVSPAEGVLAQPPAPVQPEAPVQAGAAAASSGVVSSAERAAGSNGAVASRAEGPRAREGGATSAAAAAVAAESASRSGRRAALAVEDLSAHPDDVRVAGAARPVRRAAGGPRATVRPGKRRKRLAGAAAGAVGVVVLAAGALSLMALQPFADGEGQRLGPQTASGRTPDTRFETPTSPAVAPPPVSPEQSPSPKKPKDEESPPATRPQTKPSSKPKGGGARVSANGSLRVSDGSCRGVAAPITRSCTVSLTAVGGSVRWSVSGVDPGIARVSAGGSGTLSSGRSTSVRVTITPTVSCYARGFGSATVSFSPGGSARVSYTCW